MSGDNLRLDFTASRSTGGAGAPTLTTPTLTPTTLRNIEQMFLDHQSSSILDCPPSPPEVHENAAHFVPPYVALTKSEDIVFKREPVVKDEDDEEEGDKHAIATQETETKPMYLPQGGNNIYQSTPPPPPLLLHPEFSALIENGAVVQPLPPEIALRLPLNEFPQLSVEAHVSSNEVPPLSVRPKLSPVRVLAESSGASSSSVTSSRGRRQPVRRGEPTEDEKRRLMRRQRNKEAAARCRKRRVDQTVCLEEEVSQWEERNNSSKREIEALEAQQRHLLSLLEGHRKGECKIGGVKKL